MFLIQGEEAPFKPKPLCFNDLREALPAVVMETTKREAVWSEGLGLTAAALNLDLQEKVTLVFKVQSLIIQRDKIDLNCKSLLIAKCDVTIF